MVVTGSRPQTCPKDIWRLLETGLSLLYDGPNVSLYEANDTRPHDTPKRCLECSFSVLFIFVWGIMPLKKTTAEK